MTVHRRRRLKVTLCAQTSLEALFSIFSFFLLAVACFEASAIAQSPSTTPVRVPSTEERLKALEETIEQSKDQQPKDFWDRLSAVSGLISGGLVTSVGIAATYLYNERARKNSEVQKLRELEILQVQTVQSFMPQLQSGQSKAVEAALLSIAALGNAALATSLADIYGGEGAVTALQKMASNSVIKNKEAIASLSKLADSSDIEVARSAEKSLKAILKTLSDTVVLVVAGESDKGFRRGCGFFASRDGLLVTPEYVVRDTEHIKVTFKGIDYEASVSNVQLEEKEHDLIFFQVDGDGFPVLPFPGDMTAVAGEEFFILGPIGLDNGRSLCRGTVEGYTIQKSGKRHMKVRAEITSGYAGAPAVNRRGEIVGIVVGKDDSHALLLDVSTGLDFSNQQPPQMENGIRFHLRNLFRKD